MTDNFAEITLDLEEKGKERTPRKSHRYRGISFRKTEVQRGLGKVFARQKQGRFYFPTAFEQFVSVPNCDSDTDLRSERGLY